MRGNILLMAVALSSLVEAMQAELRVGEIADYPGAFNGLQVGNGSGEVRKVGAAVAASLAVVRAACEAGAQLLLVHHGMFWSGVQPVTGAVYQKLRLALEHDLAILGKFQEYSAELLRLSLIGITGLAFCISQVFLVKNGDRTALNDV